MEKGSNPGKKWPWIIVGSILGVVALSYWTVKIAINNPVQLSDLDMQDYHHFDHDVNSIIKAKIAFDKKYDVEYVTEVFKPEKAVVRLKLTQKDGTPVDDANLTLRLTRPGTHLYDKTLPVDSVEKGVYTFEETTLEKPGRWDILVDVRAGGEQRYLNLKADTRYPNVFEY